MIENTSRRDPLVHFAASMSGPDTYITDMESAGQQQLVKSDLLPTDCRNHPEFEALGFVFGEVVEDDPLFRHATLPQGWKREASDHAMWSYLVDETGTRRVAIFYKAAFYDRRAFMRLEYAPEGETA